MSDLSNKSKSYIGCVYIIVYITYVYIYIIINIYIYILNYLIRSLQSNSLSQYSKLATFMTGRNHEIQSSTESGMSRRSGPVAPPKKKQIDTIGIRLEPDKWVVAMLSSLHQ